MIGTEGQKKTLFAVFAAVALTMGAVGGAHAGTVAGAAKKGVPLGYAKISNFVDSVLAFGGKGTTSVTMTNPSTGTAEIHFIGKYPTDITSQDVLVFSTAAPFQYGVTNAYATSASPTEIVVLVNQWDSTTGNEQDSTLVVSVMVGKSPL